MNRSMPKSLAAAVALTAAMAGVLVQVTPAAATDPCSTGGFALVACVDELIATAQQGAAGVPAASVAAIFDAASLRVQHADVACGTSATYCVDPAEVAALQDLATAEGLFGTDRATAITAAQSAARAAAADVSACLGTTLSCPTALDAAVADVVTAVAAVLVNTAVCTDTNLCDQVNPVVAQAETDAAALISAADALASGCVPASGICLARQTEATASEGAASAVLVSTVDLVSVCDGGASLCATLLSDIAAVDAYAAAVVTPLVGDVPIVTDDTASDPAVGSVLAVTIPGQVDVSSSMLTILGEADTIEVTTDAVSGGPAGLDSDPGGTENKEPMHISCAHGNYKFSNNYGTFNLRFNCPYNNSNWSFQLSGYSQSLTEGEPVNESGLQWTRNGAARPQNSPHAGYAANYQFHGTLTPTYKQDIISFSDTISWSVPQDEWTYTEYAVYAYGRYRAVS